MFFSPEIAAPYPPNRPGRPSPELTDWNRKRAQQLYAAQRRRNLLHHIGSMVTRRSNRLLRLATALHHQSIKQQHSGGLQTIALDAIRGSENRCEDFDRWFAPLNGITSERWLSVATARLNNVPVPAIEVVQIGDAYFVRDGHHRVSVARALGEDFIEANVLVWEVEPRPMALSATCPPAREYTSSLTI